MRDMPELPGEWAIRRCSDHGEEYDMLWFVCPRKRGMCAVPLLPKRNPNGSGWAWDEGMLTLSPSINCVGGCGWHGFIKNGEIRDA